MAETTATTAELSRDDLATRLHELANQFSGEQAIEVEIDNKSVTLNPPAQVAYEIEVEEREPMIGDETETIVLELSWTPQTQD